MATVKVTEKIIEKAKQFKLDPALVFAIIRKESDFNIMDKRVEPTLEKVSDPEAGLIEDASVGLMQVLYSTAKSMGYKGSMEGLYDVDTNVYYGCRYLASRLSKYKDLPFDVQIATYNSGSPLWTDYTHTAVKNAYYSKMVLQFYAEYKEIFKDGFSKDSMIKSVVLGSIIGGMAIWLYPKMTGAR